MNTLLRRLSLFVFVATLSAIYCESASADRYVRRRGVFGREVDRVHVISANGVLVSNNILAGFQSAIPVFQSAISTFGGRGIDDTDTGRGTNNSGRGVTVGASWEEYTAVQREANDLLTRTAALVGGVAPSLQGPITKAPLEAPTIANPWQLRP